MDPKDLAGDGYWRTHDGFIVTYDAYSVNLNGEKWGDDLQKGFHCLASSDTLEEVDPDCRHVPVKREFSIPADATEACSCPARSSGSSRKCSADCDCGKCETCHRYGSRGAYGCHRGCPWV